MAMAPVIKLVLGSIAFAIFWVLVVFPSVPLLPIGRTAGSLFGAMLMVIFQVITPEQAYAAIDLPILGLLFGTMVVSIYLERADMFKYLGTLLSWKSRGPKDLLCRVCLVSAVSSALFTNDTSCVVLTEFVLKIARQKNLPPHPFLLALATSANIDSLAQSLSVASILGNYLGIFIFLLAESRIKLKDQVWCFFSKENKYERGERQTRKTKSGHWKITGKPKVIMRTRDNREKIEYHTFSPNQMTMTFTICKVMFKGEETEFSPSSAGSRSLIPHLVNNSGGFKGSSFHSQELQNSSQFGGFLDVQEEAQLDVAATIPSEEEWKKWLVDDGNVEQRNIMFMQDNRNVYIPPKSLTGVFTDHSSGDNDSDLLSPTTNSIETLSTCDSFGSSNHRIDQIKDLQESPNSTIKLVSLTQEVSQALRTSVDTTEIKKMNPCDDARGTEIGEHKLGQETIKNKGACFFHRMIQKFVKKIHLCSSISRT